ncbi:PREDICTED: G-type lectin S-receptor-like serine/threonine-protein kinase At4g27290 isoform X1 [Prunus mume]|uniref:Receptor-like serine/threonine-protein kinase n=1 Tax=Prunus mume TaxID=102107 RepID=A0ABM0NUS1_PRUMU|nr:PREDICTED: G-type lectin S-receptor-like serine/threonine-protein kinase At4g27290 isoform X1 [Prunus mume]
MEWLNLRLASLLLSLVLPICISQDNLGPGKSIIGNQTLISSLGTFALGFFSPENSTKYFLGIWYNKIPKTPIIWVANRESPLDSPGVFTLSGDGNLVVLDTVDGTRKVVWSSNTSVPASAKNGTTGVLVDNGDLQLRFGEDTLWQSFDNPSDTFLANMKLSFNKRTGKRRAITSWAALDDPQPGKFTSGIDPKVPGQLVIWKENAIYWRSDLYVGKETNTDFGVDGDHAPSLNGTAYFLTYNSDTEEVYVTYGVSDNSVKLRVILNPNGQIELLLWLDLSKKWFSWWKKPVDTCDFYNRCGPYGACNDKNETLSSPCKCLTGFRPKFQEQWDKGNWVGGCVREKALMCKEDGFSKFSKLKLPDHAVLLENMSMSACASKCFQNCSCTAYAYPNVTAGSIRKCLTWFGDLMDILDDQPVDSPSVQNYGHDVYIRVHGSQLGLKSHSHNVLKKSPVIGIASATGVLITLVLGYFFWKKHLGMEGSTEGSMSETISKARAEAAKNDAELPLFSLKRVLAATNNFSVANKLGEGGFGPVYKGVLLENQEVAIKRLSKKSAQGHQEFMNELKLIAKLQHTNLVRLLGCCIEEEELILIYEFMPNRSLDKLLFAPSNNTELDWGRRFRIIEGIAQGLLYIHKYSRLKIIHRDLKASNVLLDGAMNPKISDFGMAKIFEINQTEANTNRVVGTYGYMSPEYARYGHFSEKLDVFSFGVLLLEIVSGKRNAAFYRFEHSPTLAGWAWELWKEGRGMEVIDASVRETCPPDEALKCIHVGFLCVQEAPADRPTMSSVIRMLQANEATSLPPSKEPAFSTHKNSIPAAVSSSGQTPASFSNNTVTNSLAEGR